MVKAVVFLCKETRIHPLRSAVSLYIPEYMAAVTLGAVARPTGADDAGRKPSESELDRGALLRGELVDSSDDECESVVSVEDHGGDSDVRCVAGPWVALKETGALVCSYCSVEVFCRASVCLA